MESTNPIVVPECPRGWRLWRRQVGAMLGLELRKTFLRVRAVPVVAVAFLPALVVGIHVLAAWFEPSRALAAPDLARFFGAMFHVFFLRLVTFFVCFATFTYLVRGEMAERSLHVYLLAPLRREVFLLGKYVAGCVAAGTVLLAGLGAELGIAFLTGVVPGGREYLLGGPGGAQAAAYVGVLLLAVVGYGAVFLALATVGANPMIPAAAILGWESLNVLLPPALKKISVIHYLQSLCPLPPQNGPFALPAEPTPAPLAIAGLLLVSAALVGVALWRARRLEVGYGAD